MNKRTSDGLSGVIGASVGGIAGGALSDLLMISGQLPRMTFAAFTRLLTAILARWIVSRMRSPPGI